MISSYFFIRIILLIYFLSTTPFQTQQGIFHIPSITDMSTALCTHKGRQKPFVSSLAPSSNENSRKPENLFTCVCEDSIQYLVNTS